MSELMPSLTRRRLLTSLSAVALTPLAARAERRLIANEYFEVREVEVQLASLDPAHDSPAELEKYRARYGLQDAKRWRIFVGDDAQVRTLTMLLEFKYTKNPESGVILHDNTVFLVGPEGDVKTTMSSLDQPMDEFVAAVPMPAAPKKTKQ